MTDDRQSELEALRRCIDELDVQLLDVLQHRFALTGQVGALKARTGLPARDPAREAAQQARFLQLARERGIDPDLAVTLLERIVAKVVEDHARWR